MSLVTSARIKELWAEIKSKIYFKSEQTQDIVDGSVSNATLTLTRRDGTTKGLTVNNVSNATNATLATKATSDGNGNNIASSYLLKADAIDAINLVQDMMNDPWAHNCIYRGKNLGTLSSVSEVETFISEHGISTGTFKDLYIGDYVTLKDGTYNKEWIVAGLNYNLNRGCQVNHVAMIPRLNLLKSVMNSTNTTTGGYYNSYMNQTTIPTVVTNMKNVLGNHMLTFRALVSDTVNTSAYSMAGANWKGSVTGTWTWRNFNAILMSEVQVYGSMIWSSSAYDIMSACEQLPYFRYHRIREDTGADYWLSGVANPTAFAFVSSSGSALYAYASDSHCVRPLILLG